MLPRCLAAAQPAVDEMIIVDTGSTDRTVEIAESFGATRHRPRVDRLVRRRPQRLASTPPPATGSSTSTPTRCSSPRTPTALRALTGRTWREAFYLVETNFTGDIEDGTARHPQRAARVPQPPRVPLQGPPARADRLRRCPATCPSASSTRQLRIEHYGYLGVVRDAKDKSRRNLELLLSSRSPRAPESAFLHFNLGSEYARARRERAPRSTSFEKAWEMIADRPAAATPTAFMPDARRAGSSRALRDLGAPRGRDRARRRGPRAASPASPTSSSSRRCDAAPAATTRGAPRCSSAASRWATRRRRYSATVGCGTLPVADRARADPARRGEPPRPTRCSTRCLDEHPGFLGAVHPFAAAMLARARARPRSCARDRVARRRADAERPLHARHRPVRGRRRRGGRGAVPRRARARSRAASPRASRSPRRCCRRRATPRPPTVAAERRRGRPARRRRPPHRAVRACSSRASSRPPPRVLDARRATELPRRPRLSCSSAWLRPRRGRRRCRARRCRRRRPAARHRARGAPARARGRRLRRCSCRWSTRVGLPPRERRELLASMYLRRGFLESAADEWIDRLPGATRATCARSTGLARSRPRRECPTTRSSSRARRARWTRGTDVRRDCSRGSSRWRRRPRRRPAG